jgi:hypothetical protein
MARTMGAMTTTTDKAMEIRIITRTATRGTRMTVVVATKKRKKCGDKTKTRASISGFVLRVESNVWEEMNVNSDFGY